MADYYHLLQCELCFAQYMQWPRVRLSLCVCLSQAGVVLKWLKVGTRKQRHMAAQGLVFCCQMILLKVEQGQPQRERQMQVGWVKVGKFRQITCYISKKVED